MIDPLVSQGEVECQLWLLCAALETETGEFEKRATEAAVAEADYKIQVAHAWLDCAVDRPKITVGERQARAEVASSVELRAFKIAEARRNSTKEALSSYRARLDSLRSLLASIRAQT